MSSYDWKRSVRIKGEYGEVEIKIHDTELSRSSNSAPHIETLMKQAIAGYNAIKEEKTK